MNQPPKGWTTEAQVVRVKDGDTLVARVVREFDVRIENEERNFDAPEIFKPSSAEEKALGLKFKERLEALLTTETLEEVVEYLPVTAIHNGSQELLYVKKVTKVSKRRFKDVVLYIPQDGCKFSNITQLSRIGGMVFVDGVDITEELKKLEKQ